MFAQSEQAENGNWNYGEKKGQSLWELWELQETQHHTLGPQEKREGSCESIQ